MEPQQQITISGQELQADDFNNVASEAAHVDDYVLAELLRLSPRQSTTIARGILPFGTDGTVEGATFDNSNTNVTVRATSSADGSVLVFPFRAVIGPRVIQNTTTQQLQALRDIRSAIYCPPNGANGFGFPKVAIAANASGSPRWDLISALVQIDQPASSVTRYVKPPSPSTASGAPTSIVPQLVTTVTTITTQGTAAASPVFPAVPADSGSSYYIPLAYVRVPNGFSGTWTVLATDICDAAPILGLYSSARMMPASSLFKPGESVLSTAAQQSWGSSGTRPVAYAPPQIGTGPGRFIQLDFLSASSAAWSHASGAVVDDSTDWTLRWFRVTVQSSTSVTSKFATEHTSPVANDACPSARHGFYVSLGSSMLASGTGEVLFANNSVVPMDASGAISLTVNSSGQLIITVTGTPLAKFFIWLESSQPFSQR